MRRARCAGCDHLQRRLCRNRSRGRGTGGAPDRKSASPGRARDRTEFDRPGEREQWRDHHRQRGLRDRQPDPRRGQRGLAKRHHHRDAALPRRCTRAGIFQAGVGGQRIRPRRGRAGRDPRRRSGNQRHPAVSRDHPGCGTPRSCSAPRARRGQARGRLQARPLGPGRGAGEIAYRRAGGQRCGGRCLVPPQRHPARRHARDARGDRAAGRRPPAAGPEPRPARGRGHHHRRRRSQRGRPAGNAGHRDVDAGCRIDRRPRSKRA